MEEARKEPKKEPKEILRQQLELLAEVSKKETLNGLELAEITNSMCAIYKLIKPFS